MKMAYCCQQILGKATKFSSFCANIKIIVSDSRNSMGAFFTTYQADMHYLSMLVDLKQTRRERKNKNYKSTKKNPRSSLSYQLISCRQGGEA